MAGLGGGAAPGHAAVVLQQHALVGAAQKADGLRLRLGSLPGQQLNPAQRPNRRAERGGLYGLLSLRYPLTAGEGTLLTLMEQGFELSWLCALPAVVMVALPLCRLNVRFAIIASSACAFVLSMFVQDLSLGEALRTCVFGYQPTDPVLASIFAGGGLLSMVKVAGIVALSGTFSGIFEGTRMLEGLQEKLSRLAEKLSCCGVLLLSSGGIVAVFCNQTIGILMAEQLPGPG